MCYEPQPKPVCSCKHSPVWHDDGAGACHHRDGCACREYDGLPDRIPDWVYRMDNGECWSREEFDRCHPWFPSGEDTWDEGMTFEEVEKEITRRKRRFDRGEDITGTSVPEVPDGKPESFYRDLLAAQVGGRTEVTLPFGRADVMTDTMVWEVEPASRWRDGVAQALQYAAQVPQRGAIAVYGKEAAVEKVQAALRQLPPPGLDLWWLEDGQFARVDLPAAHPAA